MDIDIAGDVVSLQTFVRTFSGRMIRWLVVLGNCNRHQVLYELTNGVCCKSMDRTGEHVCMAGYGRVVKPGHLALVGVQSQTFLKQDALKNACGYCHT